MKPGDLLHQERGYRRGLVLGLTMAEIVVLIIFCLLLALGLMVQKQNQAIIDLRNAYESAEAERVKLVERLKQAEKLIGGQQKFDDLFHELELAKQRAAQVTKLQDQIVALQERQKQLDAIEKLMGAPADQAVSPDEALKALIDKAQAGDAIARAISESGGAASPDAAKKAIQKLAQGKAEAERQVATLQGQLKNLQQKLGDLGRGTEMPACWASPTTGAPEYIFDVALTSTSFIVRDRKLLNRKDDEAQLPIGGIRFEQDLSPDEFVAASRPLLDWSVAHQCRFFVHVFDLTGPTEKAIYKRQIRILGYSFYSYEMLNDKFIRAQ